MELIITPNTNVDDLLNNEEFDSFIFRNFETNTELQFEILRKIENKFNIRELSIFLENKNYSDENIKLLRRIEDKNVNIIIHCEGDKLSLDDFETVRATINYYVDLIKSANLSPLEEAIYAYDIVKTFPYKKESDEEKRDIKTSSRHLLGIIKSGNITCLGYDKLFIQILKECGHKVLSGGVYCAGMEDTAIMPLVSEELINHERILLYIDDKKYNYSGWSCCDPTWEYNPKDENEEVMHNYLYFLIPFSEYYSVFGNNSKPDYASQFSNLTEDDKKILNEFIISDNDSDFMKSPYSVSLSNEQFINAIYEVRIKQGYTQEQAEFLAQSYGELYLRRFPSK